MTCSRCGIPDGATTSAHRSLHLLLPTEHGRQRVAAALRERGHRVDAARRVVTVELDGNVETVVDLVRSTLTSAERTESRAFLASGDTAGDDLALAMAAEPIDALRARLQAGWLADMLREQRLVSMLQPIVAVATREVFAYECLVRGRTDDGLVSPDRLFDVARAGGLLPQLDVAARRAGVRAAAQREGSHHVFVNFTPSTVYDPRFCLRTTLEAIREVGIEPDRVVFEVVESEQIQDLDHVRSILDAYRAEGFAVALDDLGSGYASLGLLHALRPDYVKIDMGLVRNVDLDPWKATFMAKLLEAARDVGVRSIAEGIETPGELAWVEQHGADYAQGYLLGRPAFAEDPNAARPALLPATSLVRREGERAS